MCYSVYLGTPFVSGPSLFLLYVSLSLVYPPISIQRFIATGSVENTSVFVQRFLMVLGSVVDVVYLLDLTSEVSNNANYSS